MTQRLRRTPAAAAVCGLCVLGDVAAPALAPVALAWPAHGIRHTAHVTKPTACVRRAKHRPHRVRRCRAGRHGLTNKAPVSSVLAPALAPALVVEPVAPPAPVPVPSAPSAPPTTPTSESGESPGPSEPPVEPPSVAQVQVSAVEYSFSLSRTTVPAGKVVLQFVNNGQDEHNLNIEPSGGPLAGSFPSTPSKGIGDLELEMRPGSYTLFCSLPTHESKGMKATLVVE
jgi:plastocyanin